MRIPLCAAVVGALLLPGPALAKAVVTVVCKNPCKVKIADKRGEKISETQYRYDQLDAGIWKVEASRGLQGGWADIPAEGAVEIQLSEDAMLVNGQFALDERGKKEVEKLREQEKRAAQAQEKKEKKEREKQEKAEKEAQKKAEEQARRDGAAKPAAASAKSGKVKLAVTRLVARTGVDQPTADLFGDALIGELRKHAGLAVTDPKEIAAVLGAEREKQLLGCSDNSCMAELGGALGVDNLLAGTVGRVGKSLIVSLTIVDSKKGDSLTSLTERLKSSSDEAFFDELPRMVTQLLKPLAVK